MRNRLQRYVAVIDVGINDKCALVLVYKWYIYPMCVCLLIYVVINYRNKQTVTKTDPKFSRVNRALSHLQTLLFVIN